MNGLTEHHPKNEKGIITGGETSGVGLLIRWQEGPLVEAVNAIEPGQPPVMVTKPKNGAFLEDVIAAAIGRLEACQTTAMACGENGLALIHLRQANEALQSRKKRREDEGKQGSHTP